jgi:hypothetical protein
MKKGDVVVINDGSWSRVIKDNKLIHGPGGDKYRVDRDHNYIRKQYVIIETGCSFPNTGSSNTFNNTVIQAIDSGKVVFIEERFLKLVPPPTHEVVVDIIFHSGYGIGGKIVEISDKLYEKIKNES